MNLKKYGNRRTILVLFSSLMILFSVMLFQVPIEIVIAEGVVPDIPKSIKYFVVDWFNFSFKLEELNISVVIDGAECHFYLRNADVAVLSQKKENSTFLSVFIDVDEAYLETSKIKVNMRNLLIKMSMVIDVKTTFRVTTTCYESVYGLLWNAIMGFHSHQNVTDLPT